MLKLAQWLRDAEISAQDMEHEWMIFYRRRPEPMTVGWLVVRSDRSLLSTIQHPKIFSLERLEELEDGRKSSPRASVNV